MTALTVRITQLGVLRALDFPPQPGREQDLGRLLEALRRFPALTITGYRGIGKSTLAASLLGHYSGGTQAPGFQNLIWCSLHSDESFAEVCGRVLPNVTGEREPGTSFGHLSDTEQARRLLEALRTRSVLLIFDNADLTVRSRTRIPADRGFAEFFGGIGRDLGASRLVLTAREGLDGEEGRGGPERFALGGLSAHAGAETLRRIGADPERQLPFDLLLKASERVTGHPGGLRMLSVLTQRGGSRGLHGYIADPRLWNGSPEEVAQGLFERVVARVLTEDARRVVLAASFFGTAVGSEGLAAAAELPVGKVAPVCEGLANDGILQKTSRGWLLGKLWRSAVARRMKPAMQDRLRRKTEAWWLGTPPPPGALRWDVTPVRPQLAAIESAIERRDLAEATKLFLDAGVSQQLQRSGMVSRVLTMFMRIISLNRGSGAFAPATRVADERLLEIMQRALQLSVQLNRATDGVSLGMEALTLAERWGDLGAQGWILWSMGTLAMQAGEHERAGHSFARARDAALQAGDPITQAAALMGIGRIHFAGGDHVPALHAFEEAADLYADDEIQDGVGRGTALYYAAAVYEYQGDVAEAGVRLREASGLLVEARSDLADEALALLRSVEGRGG